MQKLHFEKMIHASPEKVWDAIVNDKKYRAWTSAFNEGSFFEGSWGKGDWIRFLAINDKGEKEGMFSEIAESRKPEFISIRHLGIISKGKEDRESDFAKKWAPAYENYTLTKVDTETKFEVDMDIEDEFCEMFKEMWPRALALLKQVAEKG